MSMPLIDETYPAWMLTKKDGAPDNPRRETRKFNNKVVTGYLGYARLSDLNGWAGNPRIEVLVENWREKTGRIDPSNLELLDIMLDYSQSNVTADDEYQDDEADSRSQAGNSLINLAKNINLNSIRHALVVTPDKRLLDGNRRYFASLYLCEQTRDEEDRRRFEIVPVWVLPEGITDKDEDVILTELNAINDCYLKWPYSVMADRIYRDSLKYDMETLSRKYHDYTKSRIRQTIAAAEVAEEFVAHHGDTPEARELAYRNLIWFDELRRSNTGALKNMDFKETIFDLINQGKNQPFSSHSDFKGLEAIYNNPKAWSILQTTKTKEDLRRAQFEVQRERFEGKSDANSRMSRVNELLAPIVQMGAFGQVNPDTLAAFHELAARVPWVGVDVQSRTAQAIALLDGLTSKEMVDLDEEFVLDLAKVLERVKAQTTATRVDDGATNVG